MVTRAHPVKCITTHVRNTSQLNDYTKFSFLQRSDMLDQLQVMLTLIHPVSVKQSCSDEIT